MIYMGDHQTLFRKLINRILLVLQSHEGRALNMSIKIFQFDKNKDMGENVKRTDTYNDSYMYMGNKTEKQWNFYQH